ncbi:MAG: glycosyltransferase family 4 protein [Thermodesulfobacteriota bacterium]|nr:glycosyltransferase family 4 protein [Thermodesulfobacteriota bacterium]
MEKAPLFMMRRLVHVVFFCHRFFELKAKLRDAMYDFFIVRHCISNYLVVRYLHRQRAKLLLEMHGFRHIEDQEYGQSKRSSLYFESIARMERSVLNWADAVTVVSGGLRALCVRLGVDGRKIHVIHNGVDPEKFRGPTDPEPVLKTYDLKKAVVVGFVGSFARYHGLDILIGIAKTLANRVQGLRFLIVGKNVHGSDDWRNEVAIGGVGQIFTFTGEVPHHLIPKYISAMDIAVIPDFNTYGSPMKLFEYMAMGRAVVAPDVGPIREIVSNGETGVLFKKGDVAGASKSVELLIRNRPLRDAIGQRARQKVLRQYTWERNAARIRRIAEGLI